MSNPIDEFDTLEDFLDKHTVNSLKAIAQTYDIPQSGNKRELAIRIWNFFVEDSGIDRDNDSPEVVEHEEEDIELEVPLTLNRATAQDAPNNLSPTVMSNSNANINTGSTPVSSNNNNNNSTSISNDIQGLSFETKMELIMHRILSLERMMTRNTVNISDALKLKKYIDLWPEVKVSSSRDQNELDILIKAGRLANELFETEKGPASEIIWKELKDLIALRIVQVRTANQEGWDIAKSITTEKSNAVYKDHDGAVKEARKVAAKKRKFSISTPLKKIEGPPKKKVLTTAKTNRNLIVPKVKKIICYTCNEPGHKSSECPKHKN